MDNNNEKYTIEYRRKRAKRLTAIAIALTVVLAITIIIVIPKTGVFHKKKVSEKLPTELSIDDFPKSTVPADIQAQNDARLKKRLDEMKNQPSDIEGWSVYDKYKYGLNTANGSDTDKDGLTDKEELEVYGTDPRKISTADDLYTDGEKVSSGMDPLKPADRDGEKTISDETGAITIDISSPWDYYATINDNTETYSKDGAGLLTKLPNSFYKAYSVYGYDGDTVTVNLGIVAPEIGMNASDLDIEAYASRHNESKTKRKGDIITVTFDNVEAFDSGVGMKRYDIFIVDKKGLFKKAPMNNTAIMINNAAPTNNAGDVSNDASAYCGYIMRDVFLELITGDGAVITPAVDATEEEKDAMYNIMVLWHNNNPHLFSIPLANREKFDYWTPQKRTREEIKQEIENWEKRHGESAVITDVYNLPRKMHAMCPPDVFMNSYNREVKMNTPEPESRSAEFDVDDEFSFANFDTAYLINVNEKAQERCGVCAGMAQIAAEVYNNGALKTPTDEYEAEVSFKGEDIIQTLSYDISPYEELNTFFDRYLSDYRRLRGGVLEFDNVWELAPDEHEFVKMVTCYWRKTNDVQNNAVDYADTLMTNKSGYLLSWETVENATRYLDDNKILLCAMNINNMYNQGHEVNLVSYERGMTTLEDGFDYETVTFNVYDCNYPNCFLKLDCYKVETNSGKSAMLYKYNTCSNEYYSSFMADEYEIGETEGTKCIKFAIFNEKGQCLNIKLD